MKPTVRTFGVLAILLAMTGAAATAQTKFPAETRNAALRYWMAFAELQDVPADQATQDLLAKVAAGEAPWDEARLGPILDNNEAAVLAMQRATKLPECDWGLEYSRGPRASIAYVPKARVLARLNTLYGIRAMAKGDSGTAVNTWLDGIRFSQHVAEGGTLIFQLIARTALLPNLNAIANAARSSQLNDVQRRELRSAIARLPESGFDWGSAWNLETATIEIASREILKSSDPRKTYQDITGEAPPPELALSAAGHTQFLRYMRQVAEALEQPPAAAETRLKTLSTVRATLAPYLGHLVPSPERVNSARKEVSQARAATLGALGGS